MNNKGRKIILELLIFLVYVICSTATLFIISKLADVIVTPLLKNGVIVAIYTYLMTKAYKYYKKWKKKKEEEDSKFY